jgi:hypothetical protein
MYTSLKIELRGQFNNEISGQIYSLYKMGSNLEILLKLGLLVGVGLVRVFGVGAGTIFGAVAPEPATRYMGPVLVNL